MTNTQNESVENGRERRAWTVMVYMAAENSSELDAVAIEDLREMERGANPDVHVAVQINRAWPPVPQRYEVRRSGPNEIVNEDRELTNMGKTETLVHFLKWALREFPANNYCLVLWGHAYGLGFGRDHDEPLTLKGLAHALQEFRDARQSDDRTNTSKSDGRLELLGANACAMSYVEAAYELRNHAEYMVASQISVPYAGWPYESILSRIGTAPDAETLGELVLHAYVSHFNGLVAGERVTMSLLKPGALLDLGALQFDNVRDFKDLIERFAVALQEESRSDGPFGDRRAYVRDVFMAAASGDVRPLIDLRDLCHDFSDAQSNDLSSVITVVLQVLDDLVIDHDGHPDLLEDLHGVGIFAPFVTDDADLKRLELQDEDRDGSGQTKLGKGAYDDLALFGGEGAAWPRLVYDELRQTTPSELMNCLTSLSASSRTDRRDITQIVLAIESSFNKLDRVLAEGRARINTALEPDAKRKSTPKRPPASNAKTTGPVSKEVRKRFGPPWLKLIQPPDLDAQLATLKQVLTLKAFERAATAPAGSEHARSFKVGSIDELNLELLGSHPELLDPIRNVDPALVNSVVDFFDRVERAVGEVERASRKGLTNARLGLGPSAPERFTLAEEPKTGGGHGFADEEPKTGGGHGFTDEEPKTGGGHGSNGFPGGSRDLRVDLAFARVVELFGQVGQSLRQLEDATLNLEAVTRETVSNTQVQQLTRTDLRNAAAGILRALGLVQEASKNARRMIRRVFFHPVYGLGPGSDAIGLEERQALANAGGLSKLNLRLL